MASSLIDNHVDRSHNPAKLARQGGETPCSESIPAPEIPIEGGIEELAWSVRNLYEIDLTLRYVLQGAEYLDEWTAQMFTDEKDVVEGFLSLADKLPAQDRV